MLEPRAERCCQSKTFFKEVARVLLISGGMDLFKLGDGRWDISFVAIDCPTVPGEEGNIQLRFQGSNPWYIKLQVRNAKLVSSTGKNHIMSFTSYKDSKLVIGFFPIRH